MGRLSVLADTGQTNLVSMNLLRVLNVKVFHKVLVSQSH